MSTKTTEELIEELALSVGRGFQEQQEHLTDLEHGLREGLSAITTRLDRIEFLATGQEKRISVLEDRVRQLSTKVGLQFN